MIFLDHESLKYLKGQVKLNWRHVKWVDIIEMFLYVIKYKQDMENIVVDALSQRYILLSTVNVKFLGFKYMKELYTNDSDFTNVYVAYEKLVFGKFYKLDGYLFEYNKLCVLGSFMHELFIREARGGNLIGNFSVKKALDIFQ
jgi:hypothetical protein